MRVYAAAAAIALATCLALTTTGHADSGVVEPLSNHESDIAGWRGLPWGSSLDQAISVFEEEPFRRDPIEVGGCYFTTAVPVFFLDEEWEAWLCQDRVTGLLTAVSLEKGFGDMFFDERRSTALYSTFLAELTERYGPAHEFWQYCHNARWRETVQHRWFFPTTTVSLLLRDASDRWVSIRFEQRNNNPNYGPGVCVTGPRDLRG